MGVASSGGLPHTPGVRLSFEGDYLSRATIYCVITVMCFRRNLLFYQGELAKYDVKQYTRVEINLY